MDTVHTNEKRRNLVNDMGTSLTSEKLLDAINLAHLVGRGGSGYSTATKWKEMYDKKHPEIYMAVNGSEGEPGTLKDGYILKHHLDALLFGIDCAYSIFLQTKTIYLYLRKDYFTEFREAIEVLIKKAYPKLPLVVFCEPGGYLCGENTVLVNAIEEKRLEPRRKPPYISTKGLFGLPTIVNNLETFYRVGQIANGTYQDTRLYSITGEVQHPGVYDAKNNITVEKLLIQTNNPISQSAFVQLGGGASGMYVPYEKLAETPANRGTGALLIYDARKISFESLLQNKIQFLLGENCGKCTPCREGVYRIHEMLTTKTYNETTCLAIAETMAKTSFCGLGAGAGTAILSLLRNKEVLWKK